MVLPMNHGFQAGILGDERRIVARIWRFATIHLAMGQSELMTLGPLT